LSLTSAATAAAAAACPLIMMAVLAEGCLNYRKEGRKKKYLGSLQWALSFLVKEGLGTLDELLREHSDPVVSQLCCFPAQEQLHSQQQSSSSSALAALMTFCHLLSAQ
jgi:hypothetical protein